MVDSFTPPLAVQNAARRGQQLQKQFGRKDLPRETSVAERLAKGEKIGLDEIRMMWKYLDRAESACEPQERFTDGGPTSQAVAWLLAGGAPGRTWAHTVCKRSQHTARESTLHVRSVDDLEIDDTQKTQLTELISKHNEENDVPSQRAHEDAVAQVYARAVKAGLSKPISRVNSFMRLLRKGQPGNKAYTHDNDLLPPSHARAIFKSPNGSVDVLKVDEELGIVFGYAIVCKQNGEAYFDTQGDYIPEDAMLKASARFMEGNRAARDMHEGDSVGKVIFALPVTQDISESLELNARKTGLVVGMKPDSREMLNKYRSGEYTGFSIGGRRLVDTEVNPNR